MIALFLNTFRLLKAILRSWESPGFRSALLLVILLLLSATLFYRSVEGWSWIDAFYFSTMTIATVGLPQISPQTDIGKIFTVIYIFVGAGVFIALVLRFAKALLKQDD